MDHRDAPLQQLVTRFDDGAHPAGTDPDRQAVTAATQPVALGLAVVAWGWSQRQAASH
ncbi:MAG: hypothetical protein ACT4QD_18365 [Acidobacteriota bacterium]